MLSGGTTVTSVRLPVMLLAALLIGAVFWFGQAYCGWQVGLWAALLLGTTGKFAWFGTRFNLDIPLIFFTTLGGFFLYEQVYGGSKRKVWGIVGMGMLGGGILVKGPVALLPLVGLIGFVLLEGEPKKLGKVPWLWGIGLCLLLVLSWLVPAVLQEGMSYFHHVVTDQIYGYAAGEMGHREPYYYYLTRFPLESLPWGLFFLFSLPFILKNPPENRFVRFQLVLFTVLFALFTLFSSKRGQYLLQVYPSVVIVVAWFFSKHAQSDPNRTFAGYVLPGSGLLFSLFLIAGGVLLWGKGGHLLHEYVSETGHFDTLSSLIIPFALVLAAGGVVTGLCSLFARRRNLIYVISGFVVVLLLLTHILVVPAVNPLKSSRPLVQEIRNREEPGMKIGFWGSRNRDAGICFYLDRTVPLLGGTEEAMAFLDQRMGDVLIMETYRYERLPSGFVDRHELIYTGRVGDERMYVLKRGS